MEFNRFGGTIPGMYWGCCAADIIQDFNQDPSTKASSQLVLGDSGTAITCRGALAFVGPTLKDVFEARIRLGTFSNRDMPNHVFFAILTDDQCRQTIGKAWLKILKENGFEFFRKVNNSVWNVNNNIFILVRNCGPNSIADPFEPPAAWKALPSVVPETWEGISGEIRKNFITEQNKAQKEIWEKGTTVIRTESEIVAAEAPVILAALRTEFPVETKASRESRLAERKAAKLPVVPSFGTQHLF